ncbi:outer membrane beta-barrel protein [Pedobacter ginsengisoli]|uniref:outer membrane beta-barrel protein n=1 Tax=Pedobacter ginsengisoli TaxID=363852 RepID=UPI00254F3459|nr:outer membrane beta-barrel protein [Pedobacter ginsengisoli]
MKTALTSFLALFLCFNAFAQTNFNKLSVGAGYGLTQSFTDVNKNDFAPSAYGTLDYFFTPFLSLGGELQYGKIKAGPAANDPTQRQFTNSYKAASLNARLYLGALVDYDRSNFLNAVKWLYVGGGAGIVRNNITRITRVNKSTGNDFPGRNASFELMVPINVGISYYFPSQSGNHRFALNLNLQSNLTMGEGLDGYDNSSETFKDGVPDIYNFYSIGVKYHFGLLGLSKKSLY